MVRDASFKHSSITAPDRFNVFTGKRPQQLQERQFLSRQSYSEDRKSWVHTDLFLGKLSKDCSPQKLIKSYG